MRPAIDWVPGDGGVYFRVEDLFAWGKFLAGRSRFRTAIPNLMLGDPSVWDEHDYGYGFYGETLDRGRRRFRHDGRFGGARNYCHFVPSSDRLPAVFVVVLSNYDDNPSREIAQGLLERYSQAFGVAM